MFLIAVSPHLELADSRPKLALNLASFMRIISPALLLQLNPESLLLCQQKIILIFRQITLYFKQFACHRTKKAVSELTQHLVWTLTQPRRGCRHKKE